MVLISLGYIIYLSKPFWMQVGTLFRSRNEKILAFEISDEGIILHKGKYADCFFHWNKIESITLNTNRSKICLRLKNDSDLLENLEFVENQKSKLFSQKNQIKICEPISQLLKDAGYIYNNIHNKIKPTSSIKLKLK